MDRESVVKVVNNAGPEISWISHQWTNDFPELRWNNDSHGSPALNPGAEQENLLWPMRFSRTFVVS